MSLTRAQKDFIEASIDHFLDFPTEPGLLSAEIKNLTNAFGHPDDQKNDYHQLAQCLLKPKKHFQRLESYNATNITVGEVQAYIIDLVTERLTKTAEKAHISLAQNGWHAEKLKQQIITPAHQQEPFKSISISIDNRTLPWHRITDEGKIFTAALVPRDDEPYISLQVDIELPDGMRTITKDYYRILPVEEYDEQIFMSLLMPQAKISAYEIAFQAVLEFCQDASLITPGFAILASLNLDLNKLLTDQFYIDLIIDREINPSHLLSLNSAQISALLEPVTKSLIADKFMLFLQASFLTQTESLIASRYYPLLQKKIITTDQILYTRQDQGKMLLLPLVINLVNKGYLSFDTAKKLPLYLRPLLSSDLYADYFFQEKISWEKIAQLPKEYCDVILQENNGQAIAALVKNKIIMLEDFIFYKDVMELHAECYAKRLFQLHINKPITVKGTADSIEKISLALPLSAIMSQSDLTKLREQIIRKFMAALNEQVKALLNSNPSPQEKKQLIMLQKEINVITNNIIITANLSDLLTSYDKYFEKAIAREKTQQAATRYTMFAPNNYKTNMHVFSKLIDATEVKNIKRP